MNIYSVEYNRNNQLVDVSTDPELLNTILTFDREVSTVDSRHRIEYYTINYRQDMLDFINNSNLVVILHQDSERDVYVCMRCINVNQL